MKQPITIPGHSDVSPLARLFETDEPRQLEQVFSTPAEVKPRRPTDLALALRSALAPATPRKAALARMAQLPKPRTLTLDRVEGALSNLFQKLDADRVGTITLTLPFAMDHYVVNAATFKALAGRKSDTLLRRAGKRWEVVEDDEPIDLGDRSQLFRLGKVQIYS